MLFAALFQGPAPLAALPGITIVPFDVFALITAVAGNPTQFGLRNATDACITPDNPPFTCKRPDEYLFWDGIHPRPPRTGSSRGPWRSCSASEFGDRRSHAQEPPRRGARRVGLRAHGVIDELENIPASEFGFRPSPHSRRRPSLRRTSSSPASWHPELTRKDGNFQRQSYPEFIEQVRRRSREDEEEGRAHQDAAHHIRRRRRGVSHAAARKR